MWTVFSRLHLCQVLGVSNLDQQPYLSLVFRWESKTTSYWILTKLNMWLLVHHTSSVRGYGYYLHWILDLLDWHGQWSTWHRPTIKLIAITWKRAQAWENAILFCIHNFILFAASSSGWERPRAIWGMQWLFMHKSSLAWHDENSARRSCSLRDNLFCSLQGILFQWWWLPQVSCVFSHSWFWSWIFLHYAVVMVKFTLFR